MKRLDRVRKHVLDVHYYRIQDCGQHRQDFVRDYVQDHIYWRVMSSVLVSVSDRVLCRAAYRIWARLARNRIKEVEIFEDKN